MSWWDWGRYPRHKPRRPAHGIVAKTQSGKFGQTWWAGLWLQALEALVDPARLSRGRSYARGGQVLNIDVEAGRVSARVQGSQVTPYKVDIRIARLDDAAWNRAIGAMAGQAVFAAKLLAGEMPQNIEEAFGVAGASLFPRAVHELQTDCSCPDWANPCKHIAAVFYLLGEQFDGDPFLLFRLRGRTRDQVLDALRALRAGAAETRGEPPARRGRARKAPAAERPVPLAAQLDTFWMLGASLDDFRVDVSPPPVAAALAKRLGPPLFWPKGRGAPDWERVMEAVYSSVTEQAEEIG